MKKWILMAVVAVAAVGGCQHKDTETKEVSQALSWNQKMNVLSGQLRTLIPFVYDQKKFETESNFDYLKSLIRSFTQSVANVKNHPSTAYPENDPSLVVTLSRLQSDLENASESFAQKDFAFARMNLKTATQYCAYCHTRRAEGMKNNWLGEKVDLSGATSSERADYFIATRQFDRAKQELREFFAAKNSNFFAKERALKKYLVISLRATADPKDALNTIEEYLNSGDPSRYFKSLLKIWIDDLIAWDATAKKSLSLKQIKKTMDQADARKDFAFDESSSILYLNMSKNLYDLLDKDQNASERAETFYLLGRAYEVLRGVGLWNLNEIYYESCIRRHSHSNLALQCYKGLEQSVVLGYSGSGGVFIPHAVRNKLISLKDLAKPLH